MTPDYENPGVYVEEFPNLPRGIAQVETAIPAFIGYTEKAAQNDSGDLLNKPRRIGSLPEYERCFGFGPSPVVSRVDIDASNRFISAAVESRFFLYDSLRMFFANGGGDCYIVSVGLQREGVVSDAQFKAGISALASLDEPTIILLPDAVWLDDTKMAGVQQEALMQCSVLRDRVAVLDLKRDDRDGSRFRYGIGINNLSYGMAYTPWLRVTLPCKVSYTDVKSVIYRAGTQVSLKQLTEDAELISLIDSLDLACQGNEGDDQAASSIIQELEEQLSSLFPAYRDILSGVSRSVTCMPPSGAVAGIYAWIDRTRGVWKAPANVSLRYVVGPELFFTKTELEKLNVDATSGKSINAIRSFTGMGTLVYGARTLAGNHNEWRYVSVRRFFNMVEESIKKAVEPFVFEPNDSNTWVKIQSMIENFLTSLWRQGALQGSKPGHAFYVAVGLGRTMTATDVTEGRLIIEIGMAAVRPAEFIILKISQKMAEGG